MRDLKYEGDAESASPKAFEEKLNLARGVLTSFERALRTARLYKADHPVRREAVEAIQGRFRAFFDKYSFLRLEVTQTELKLEGNVLMKCEPRDPEAPFRLYKDGIREIRFHRGLEHDELFAFLAVLEMDARDMTEIELDLVSLLWTKDFKTIDYVTIDEFEMAEGENAPPVGTDLLDLGKGIRVDMATLMRALAAHEIPAAESKLPEPAAEAVHAPPPPASAPPAMVGATPPGGASAPAAGAPDAKSPGLDVTEPHVPWKVPAGMPLPAVPEPPMTSADVDALFGRSIAAPLLMLRDSIEEETMGASIIRTIALLSTSFRGAGQVSASEIGPLLRGLLELHARKGDFPRVGRLMKQLAEHDLLDRVEGGAELWRQLAELIQGPDVIKFLLTSLNSEFADDIEGLEFYLEFAGPGLVQELCLIYGRVKAQKTRSVIRDYIKANGRSLAISFKGLLEAPESILTEVFDIIRHLKPVSAAVELDDAFDRLPRAQKFDAITIAVGMEASARVRVFRRALADADITLRTHALKRAGENPSPDLQALVLEWLERDDFAMRPYDEKLLSYRTYVRLAGPAALAHIKDVASRKPSLFGGQRASETRRAAVVGLESLRTPAAHLQLQEWADGGDRTLREYAAEAMKMKA